MDTIQLISLGLTIFFGCAAGTWAFFKWSQSRSIESVKSAQQTEIERFNVEIKGLKERCEGLHEKAGRKSREIEKLREDLHALDSRIGREYITRKEFSEISAKLEKKIDGLREHIDGKIDGLREAISRTGK